MNATGPKIGAQASDADADGESEFLSEALDRYDSAWLKEQENIEEGYTDLEFLSGEGQWDSETLAERTGRPCLTINRLPQYTRQITGDIRQMRPAIKCVPVDSKGDPKLAEKRAGLIRYIENRSSASDVYFRGADSMVQAGRGAWEVTTEYAGDSTFNQEIRIAPIDDAISILWDVDAILPNKVDADWCFVPRDMSIAAYRKRWPDAPVDGLGYSHRSFTGWSTDEHIRVAVYWLRVPVKRLLLIGEGFVDDLTNADPAELAEAKKLAADAAKHGLPVRLEKRDGTKVRRAVITGTAVLEEPVDWPGRFIPIIDCPGEEIRIGRKIVRHGAVRFARDPQRMYNYYASAEAEVTALQPKAPFVGTRKNFEKFKSEWENANTENLPYLAYDPDPLNGGARPERQSPPVASTGIAEGRSRAAEDLQATTGIYNSSIGAPSNETSGKAIVAKQREGDTGTYVYVEHFGSAVAHTGRVINDLIPHIYDTTRTVRIVGEDGQEELIEINAPTVNGEAALSGDEDGAVYENDVTVGEYDIVMQMGPSFNTRREEARDGMTALLQSSPDVALGILDLVVDAQDWPNKDAVRERVELLLPPNIQAAIAEKKGEPVPGADPMAQQKMQIEAEVADKTAQAAVIDAEAKLIAAQAAKLEATLKLETLQAGGLAALAPAAAPGAPGPESVPGGPVGPSPEGDTGPAPAGDDVDEEAIAQMIVPVILEALAQGGPPPEAAMMGPPPPQPEMMPVA